MKKLKRLLLALLLVCSVLWGIYTVCPAWVITGVVQAVGQWSGNAIEEQSAEKEEVVAGALEDIRAEGEQVSQQTVDSLEDSGITGEDATFDTLYYPYYGFLSETEQAVYRQIYANVSRQYTTFVPCVEIGAEELGRAVEAVFNDHPELFWLETSYSYRYTAGGSCVQVSMQFNVLGDCLEEARAQFDSNAAAVLEVAKALNSDYERERYIHNVLLAANTYKEDALLNQSAYSAMVLGETVCAGYARAFQYLMTELEIPTYFCVGDSGGDHAWNIVKLGDGYYHVDLTWDDAAAWKYTYFNRTDADLAGTHTRTGLSVLLPACTSDAYRGLEGPAAVAVVPAAEVEESEESFAEEEPAAEVQPEQETAQEREQPEMVPEKQQIPGASDGFPGRSGEMPWHK